jgi:hypothetical protein
MDTVSLKEFLELKIDCERQLRQSERKDDKEAVGTAFETQQTALREAKSEAEKQYEQLNDVRVRFVSKEVYDKDIKDRDDREESLKKEQAVLFRWAMLAFVTMGLTIIGLGLTVVGMLMSWRT